MNNSKLYKKYALKYRIGDRFIKDGHCYRIVAVKEHIVDRNTNRYGASYEIKEKGKKYTYHTPGWVYDKNIKEYGYRYVPKNKTNKGK